VKELCPNKGETIVIDGSVSVTVLEVNGDEVVLALDAPDWIDIQEEEQVEMTPRLASCFPR
jgi:carbon storage regulator CsrA